MSETSIASSNKDTHTSKTNNSSHDPFIKAENILKKLYGSKAWNDLNENTRLSLSDSLVIISRMKARKYPLVRDYTWPNKLLKAALRTELENIFARGFIRYLTHTYGAPDINHKRQTYACWPRELLQTEGSDSEIFRSAVSIGVNKKFSLHFKKEKNTITCLEILLPDPAQKGESDLMAVRMNEYLKKILRAKDTVKTPLMLLSDRNFVENCKKALEKSASGEETETLFKDICGSPEGSGEETSGILVFLYRTFQNPSAAAKDTLQISSNHFIGEKSFNSIWKNQIRDYYVYGFYTLQQRVGNRNQTSLNNYWCWLRDTLGPEWKYSENRGTKYIQLKESSLSISENPLNVLFFTRLSRIFPKYLIILLALESETTLSINDIQNLFIDSVISKDVNSKTVNSHIETLEELGCIRRKEKYIEKAALTMQNLMNCLNMAINEESEEITTDPLTCMSDLFSFFSQYFILGEIGTMLNKRLNNIISAHGMSSIPSPFSYRQNYIQRSVYDYNLYDLLNAAEKEYICLITYSPEYYRQGVSSNDLTTYLVIPLEIRISSANGREYVLCYNLMMNKIVSLRVEYIESIRTYADVTGFKVRVCQSSGKKADNKSPDKERDFSIDATELSNTLKTAKSMIRYIWGAEVPSDPWIPKEWDKDRSLRRLIVKTDFCEPDEVNFAIPAKKSHIVIAEKNPAGGVTLTVKCFPTKEFRTWLRRLYPHILEIDDQMFSDKRYTFNIAGDIEEFERLYDSDQFPDTAPLKPDAQRSTYEFTIYQKSKTSKGKKIAAPLTSKGGSPLFNELFSKQSIDLASCVLSASRKDVSEVIRWAAVTGLQQFQPQQPRGSKSPITAADLFLDENSRPKFKTEHEDYLFQMLPLTRTECRWLLAILDDGLAGMFLSGKVLDDLKNFIVDKKPPETSALNVGPVNYFDCFVDNNNPSAEHVSSMDTGKLYRLYHSIRTDEILEINHIVRAEDTKDDQAKGEQAVTVMFSSGYGGRLPNRIMTEFSLWKKTCTCSHNENNEGSDTFKMTLYYPPEDEEDIINRILSYGPHVKVVNNNGDSAIYRELKMRMVRQKQLLEDPKSAASVRPSPKAAVISNKRTEYLRPKQLVYSRMYDTFTLIASPLDGRPDIRLPLNDILELRVVPETKELTAFLQR